MFAAIDGALLKVIIIVFIASIAGIGKLFRYLQENAQANGNRHDPRLRRPRPEAHPECRRRVFTLCRRAIE